MIGVINSPSKKGILNEAKNYSDTKLTEAKKYTNDEVAKLPSSCIRHKQSGIVETYRGSTPSAALSGFTDESKMIGFVTGCCKDKDVSFSYYCKSLTKTELNVSRFFLL